MPGQAGDWKVACREDAREPQHLRDQDGLVPVEIVECPIEQVEAVVRAPGVAGGPVVLEVVWERLEVLVADLAGERIELDRGPVPALHRVGRLLPRRRRYSLHSAMTS